MAKLITRTYVNNNSKSKAYGKTYGRIVHTETLSTDDFARHISEHGSPFDRATVAGVLMAACDCLVELTFDSKKVRLGDLGTFYMSAESTGEEDPEDFNANNISRIHLRFLPNLSRSYALDSKTLRRKASLMGIDKLDTTTANGGSSSGNGGSGTTPATDPDEGERP